MEAPESEEQSPRPGLRALAGLIAVLISLWTLWATRILPQLRPVSGLEYTLRSIGVRLLLWVVPCSGYLWLRYQRDTFQHLEWGPPKTLRQVVFAFNITLAASFAVSLDVGRKLQIPVSEVWQRLVAGMVWHFPTAALFEELIFRGVILSELLTLLGVGVVLADTSNAQRGRAWLANLMASMVFVGLHWPWWIFTEGFGPSFLTKTAGVFLLSLVLGLLFFRTRSLWPCVLLHWLNNQLSALAS